MLWRYHVSHRLPRGQQPLTADPFLLIIDDNWDSEDDENGLLIPLYNEVNHIMWLTVEDELRYRL
jgi:hypothetical protein